MIYIDNSVGDVVVLMIYTNNIAGDVVVVRRKGNLKTQGSLRLPRRVSFDPLALLLDASLEGELELVKRTAMEVNNLALILIFIFLNTSKLYAVL